MEPGGKHYFISMQEIIKAPIATVSEVLLTQALLKRHIKVIPQHWDGHKHVDIYLPEGKIYLEIDGIQHFIKPQQIIEDFRRDYYSNQEQVFVKHIPNDLINNHLDVLADAIAQVCSLEKKTLKKNFITKMEEIVQ